MPCVQCGKRQTDPAKGASPWARLVTRYPDGMPAALIWVIVAFGLAGAEALTGDMFMLMLSGGALAAAGSSWLLDLPIWADGAVFLVVSVLLLVLVRPVPVLCRLRSRGRARA